MFKTKFIVSQLILLATTILATEGSVDVKNAKTGKQNNLIFLGTHEGKLFFYGKNNGTNWHASRSICYSNGLELASFRTRAEMQFVQTRVYEIEERYVPVWTGGSLKGMEGSADNSIFEWNDSSRTPIPDDVTLVFNGAQLTHLALQLLNDDYLWTFNAIPAIADYVCQQPMI